MWRKWSYAYVRLYCRAKSLYSNNSGAVYEMQRFCKVWYINSYVSLASGHFIRCFCTLKHLSIQSDIKNSPPGNNINNENVSYNTLLYTKFKQKAHTKLTRYPAKLSSNEQQNSITKKKKERKASHRRAD